MTELARSQMSGTLIAPPVATDPSTVDQRKGNESCSMEHRQDKADSDRYTKNTLTPFIVISDSNIICNSDEHFKQKRYSVFTRNYSTI